MIFNWNAQLYPGNMFVLLKSFMVFFLSFLIQHFQVTEEVYDILKNAQAYEFNCRGKIKVKGKGDMTTYFLTDRRATATMRVDDLLHPYPNHNGQFYVNPQQHHMQQQQVQYSNIGAQNCEFLLVHIQCTTCVTRLFGCAARRLVVLLRKKINV